MSFLVGAMLCLVILAGFACVSIALSPDPTEEAWIWYRFPSFFCLMFFDWTLGHAAKVAGAWRLNPDTNSDSPVYVPTVLGKKLILVSCSVMDRIAAHPLGTVVTLHAGFNFQERVSRQREDQRSKVVGDYRWRDVPHLQRTTGKPL